MNCKISSFFLFPFYLKELFLGINCLLNIALLVDKDVTGKIILAIFNTNKESDVFLHGSDVLHVRLITHHSTFLFCIAPFLDYYRQMH